mmetsp:Transcript_8334/g.24671  ORF Transcript_8334/g.24671 Transcript_8334/m.24671 type:complete len:264 (+) Transcript_8334:646-1437(+)
MRERTGSASTCALKKGSDAHAAAASEPYASIAAVTGLDCSGARAARVASSAVSPRAAAASTRGGSPPKVVRQRGCARPVEETTSQSKVPRSTPPFEVSLHCAATGSTFVTIVPGVKLASVDSPPSRPSQRAFMPLPNGGRYLVGAPAASSASKVPELRSTPKAEPSPSQRRSTSVATRLSQRAPNSGVSAAKAGTPWSTRRSGSSRVPRVAARPPDALPISKTWRDTALEARLSRSPCAREQAATPPPMTATRGGDIVRGGSG